MPTRLWMLSTLCGVLFLSLAAVVSAHHPEVQFDGTVVGISEPHHAILVEVEHKNHPVDVIVRTTPHTIITEDGHPAGFGDIVEGDLVEILGEFTHRRHHRHRHPVVIASLINIVN